MFCGSCMRDNTLAAALIAQGHDALLVPTYTPITTDETDVSGGRVFFGGINVYLQEKSRFFRATPWLLDRIFDQRWLLKWVSRFAARTPYSELAELTVSMLKGVHGHQSKEVAKLAEWLAAEVKPDVIVLTNVLLSGIVPELKRRLGVPILATLQGDDVFLDALPRAAQIECAALIRENAKSLAGFLVTSRFYVDRMANALGLDRTTMRVVYPGINLKGHGGKHAASVPPRIGYFARICPEKGFDRLVDAFIAMRKTTAAPALLRASGWLGEGNKAFFAEQVAKLHAAGLGDDFHYEPAPDHASKVKFLQNIDLFCVPTVYQEPKGLYVLEAWANGLPVVLPRHGTFPELIEATRAGVLVPPGDTNALAAELARLLADPAERARLGGLGLAAVESRYTADVMARETLTVLREFVPHA